MRITGKLLIISITAIGFAPLGVPVALADQASAHYHKGLALKREGKVDEAIAELQKALEARENYAAAHQSLGMLYREKTSYSQAIFHLEQAAKLEPKSGEILYSLGITYHRAGHKADAVAALTRAAKLSPKDHQIQAQLGTLLIRDKPAEALPYLKAALGMQPNNPDYLHQLGLAYRRTNKLKEAEQYMLKAAAAKEDAEIEFDLGVLYRRLNQQAKAIEHYEAAIRLDPKLAPAHWDLAHMYTQEKRNDDAVQAFEEYLKLQKNGGDADIARKRIRELKGKKK